MPWGVPAFAISVQDNLFGEIPMRRCPRGLD
jgi:hypothetical protein